ncbi:MAG: hypothetical protein WC075_03225 [Dehalococcoidales bacterium]
MGSGKTGFAKNITKSEGITTEEITRALHFLNTTGMAPCGYVIYLWDEDHAIDKWRIYWLGKQQQCWFLP